MSKYKLTKKYPGSPELGFEVTHISGGVYSYKGMVPYTPLYFNLEKYSEFWEEVIEKDYEILKSCPIEGTIYSIKRLSDGEVFTLGDKFDVFVSCKAVIRTIKSITVEGGILTIHSECGIVTNTQTSGIFNKIKKVKTPIFLTHDGENIFEGDELWYVNKVNLHCSWFVADSNVTFNSDRNAYFLTVDKAKDYKYRNKEFLSYNDVLEALNLNIWGIEKLQELVNKKLNCNENNSNFRHTH